MSKKYALEKTVTKYHASSFANVSLSRDIILELDRIIHVVVDAVRIIWISSKNWDHSGKPKLMTQHLNQIQLSYSHLSLEPSVGGTSFQMVMNSGSFHTQLIFYFSCSLDPTYRIWVHSWNSFHLRSYKAQVQWLLVFRSICDSFWKDKTIGTADLTWERST